MVFVHRYQSSKRNKVNYAIYITKNNHINTVLSKSCEKGIQLPDKALNLYRVVAILCWAWRLFLLGLKEKREKINAGEIFTISSHTK